MLCRDIAQDDDGDDDGLQSDDNECFLDVEEDREEEEADLPDNCRQRVDNNLEETTKQTLEKDSPTNINATVNAGEF